MPAFTSPLLMILPAAQASPQEYFGKRVRSHPFDWNSRYIGYVGNVGPHDVISRPQPTDRYGRVRDLNFGLGGGSYEAHYATPRYVREGDEALSGFGQAPTQMFLASNLQVQTGACPPSSQAPGNCLAFVQDRLLDIADYIWLKSPLPGAMPGFLKSMTRSAMESLDRKIFTRIYCAYQGAGGKAALRAAVETDLVAIVSKLPNEVVDALDRMGGGDRIDMIADLVSRFIDEEISRCAGQQELPQFGTGRIGIGVQGQPPPPLPSQPTQQLTYMPGRSMTAIPLITVTKPTPTKSTPTSTNIVAILALAGAALVAVKLLKKK